MTEPIHDTPGGADRPAFGTEGCQLADAAFSTGSSSAGKADGDTAGSATCATLRRHASPRNPWNASLRMRSACLGWLVAALGLTPFTATPASYTLLHTTLDAGGGFATSDHYRLDASIGEPRGISRSASGDTEDRQGFVASLNDPPVPGADTFQRTSGQPGKVRLAILLANDQDPEGDHLTLTLADGRTAEGGTVGLDEGWLVYDPPVSGPEADQFRYVLEDEAGNVTTAWVTVLVAGTGLQPSLNLITTTILPNGHLRLTFAGIAGRPYRIEWTDQLPALQWNTLATIAADARGIIEWVDATEPRPAQRYYRTVGQ